MTIAIADEEREEISKAGKDLEQTQDSVRDALDIYCVAGQVPSNPIKPNQKKCIYQ